MNFDFGFSLSVTGTLLSALGFWATWKQVRETKTATEQSNIEIASLRNRLSTFDFATECTRARKSLEHSVSLLNLHQWKEAFLMLSDSQAALHRIGSNPRCTNDHRAIISEFSTTLLDEISDMEEYHKKELEIDTKNLIKEIRKTINTLDSELNSNGQEI